MRFKKTENGIIDNKTGLIWKAEDENGLFTFDNAIKQAKSTGWRLPNTDELKSILDRAKYSPSCDPVFKMMPTDYWSSKPSVNYSDYAWAVDFNDGYIGSYGRNDDLRVRLVRSMEKK